MPVITSRPFFIPPTPTLSWTFAGTETFDTGQTFDPSTQATVGYNNVELSHDGMHFYVGDNDGSNSPRYYQYNMSTPWDLTTASYASKLIDIDIDPATGFADAWGCCFKPDGTIFYAVGGDGESESKIVQYNLSSAWDVSTSGARIAVKQFDWDSGDPFPVGTQGLYIEPTGTYMFTMGGTGVRRLTLSTPWALSTATWPGEGSAANNYTPSGIGSYVADVSFDPTGTRLFLSDHSGNFHQDSLSSAYDLSTASSGSRISYNPSETSGAGGLCWRWDTGTQFFAMDGPFGSSALVYRYSIA